MTTQKNQKKVAVLGLGAMGSRMARRLLDAGMTVTVWNRSAAAATELRELGAGWAETPRLAAENNDAVLVMVTDDDAAREVWLGDDGAVRGLSDGAVAIEASTVTPSWVRELATAVGTTGAALVESPVVGSRPQAEAGQLICLTGGDRASIDEVRPVLDAFAGRLFYVGEHGQGAVAKLAVNTFYATQIAAAGEIIHFLRQAGVDDERWLDLFTNLPVVAPPIAAGMQGMAMGKFDPLFPIELVEKDLRYFQRVADESGTRHPVATSIRHLFSEAIEAGLADDNINGIVQVYLTHTKDLSESTR